MGEHGFAISCETSCMNSQLLMPHKRSLYLDQIKAVIVALVIAIHVPMAFSVGWIGIKIPVEGLLGQYLKDSSRGIQLQLIHLPYPRCFCYQDILFLVQCMKRNRSISE